MKVITIQHQNVLNQLINSGEYRAKEEFVSEILVKPYRFMQRSFGWGSTPLFMCPIGHYVEFGGAKFTSDSVAIELDIPDELCKVQLYYNWSDFIYFTEQPHEFKEACNVEKYSSVNDWGKTVIDISNSTEYNIMDADRNKDAIQVTTELLRKEWITDTLTNLVKIEEEHDGTGGRLKLKELRYYK